MTSDTNIWLRRADAQDGGEDGHDDCKDVFEWRNHPDSLRRFFNPRAVSWQDHCQWWKQAIANDNCHIYIATKDEAVKAGVIRFEVQGSVAMVSVNVAPAFFGCGLGTIIIGQGTTRLLQDAPDVVSIDALIKDDNAASIAAFSKAGYRPADTTRSGTVLLRYFRQA